MEEPETFPSGAYTVVAPSPDAVIYRPACMEDLDAVFALEEASYPADEAATYEKLKMRIEQVGDRVMSPPMHCEDRGHNRGQAGHIRDQSPVAGGSSLLI